MIRPLALTFALAATAAGAFDLQMPLDCTLGDTCFIQQYVDRDPSPGVTDFTCGPLAYDGHEGTDFALPSLAAMQTGVAVRAAAPGVVKGGRDGMPDIAVNTPGAPPLEGRDCGNGVLIEHDGGWQTQYCHMKQGSVAVRAGDVVAAGAVLGQVGLSGNTEFPHLHLTLRRDGRTIDPFDPDEVLTCGAPPAPALWATPLPYQPGGLIALGFATEVPAFDALKAGLASPATLPADAPALVLWAYAFGSRAGDALVLAITGPAGQIINESMALDRTQAQLFRAAGLRLPPAGWPAGSYSGTATLVRGNETIDTGTITLIVGN
ncbi:M23 family metallopeptidase [Fertoebacter nigrum]|uniref:M23 family metallopeptidase n=1 Tax=Fertoeibacter niger TaxID=2656921 RepID=A0A8X8KNU7_9RHOB|nr:M23 family metallopeptidase [Fertoeibacter niger]NUB44430.1 M23 family metallopeptidase [Fertoeibacter niger]